MTTGPIIGIDLGTTHSLVAILVDGRPTVLPNALGDLLTPSAVSIDDDGHVLVGAAARARALTHPDRTAIMFKRDMGTERTHTLAGRTFSPQTLSALVLEALKRDAEAALGVSITEAVVTVPAWFGEAQRQATRDAGQIAGLRVERIVNEPTAAAMAYGLHALDRELMAVVLDLGGGTFDVTVLEIVEGVVEVRSTAGDVRLGGEDFTDALAAHLVGDLDALSPITRARLRGAAEQAKRRLGEDDHARVQLDDLDLEGRRAIDATLTRAEAERVWAPLLARLEGPVRRALRDARLFPGAIDEVLLVGGATRMPCVVDLFTRLFGKPPSHALPPDEAVALGAAVQAALKADDAAVEDLVVTDVAPFTLGISVINEVGPRRIAGFFSPILERGTTIPASRVERYATTEDNQTQLTIEVYQGENAMCRENTPLGAYTLRRLPARPAGVVAVDVRFTYDLNGLLEVEMAVVDTERVEHLVIENRPGKLAPAEIERARAQMAALKFHPRDSLPNRTALSRAEALYRELIGDERRALGEAIAWLHGAIETQDAAHIDPARERLVEITRRLATRLHL